MLTSTSGNRFVSSLPHLALWPLGTSLRACAPLPGARLAQAVQGLATFGLRRVWYTQPQRSGWTASAPERLAPARRPVPFRGPGGGRAGLIGRLWKARASEKRENPLSSEPGNRTVPAVAGRTSGRRRWRVVAAVVLFLVGSLLLLQALKVGDGGDAAGHPESAAGFGHIHGIGVNPADGRVYAGTHRGVVQISEQQSRFWC